MSRTTFIFFGLLVPTKPRPLLPLSPLTFIFFPSNLFFFPLALSLKKKTPNQIGLFYSSALPPAPSEPVKFVDAARDPNHLSRGSGRAVFLVDNLRWNVTAAMTNRRWGRNDVRALSPPISFSSPNEPQQLHVAPGADPTTAVVQWATADASRPRVRWSTSPLTTTTTGPSAKSSNDNNGGSGNSSVVVVEGETSTYTRNQMCGGSAKGAGWFEPGSLHRATLRGLPAASWVFYEVYDAGDEEGRGGGGGGGGSGDGASGAGAAAAVRRSGSFFTPALPREEGHEEARIVLMADAGKFRAFFSLLFFFFREREREGKGKERSKRMKLSLSLTLSLSRSKNSPTTKKRNQQERETRPRPRNPRDGSLPPRETPRSRSQPTWNRPRRPERRRARRKQRRRRRTRKGSSPVSSTAGCSSTPETSPTRSGTARSGTLFSSSGGPRWRGLGMPRWWATTVSFFFFFETETNFPFFSAESFFFSSRYFSSSFSFYFSSSSSSSFSDLFFSFHFLFFLTTSTPTSTEANWPGTPWGRYGNASEDSGGECGVPFFARIASPGDESKSNGSILLSSSATSNGPSTFSASPWWSLEEGPVKVVGYSTEHDFSRGSEQFSFLERELLLSRGEAERRRAPWLVVVGHRPIYIDSNFSGRAAPPAAAAAEAPLNASDVAVSRDLRRELEPLFLEAGVDATFHGHHHSWQRTCATDGSGECVSDAENNDGGAGAAAAAAGSGGGGGGERAAAAAAAAAPLSKNKGRKNATVHFVIGHGGGDFTDGSLQVPTPPLFQSVEFQHGHARLRADGGAMTVEAVRASDGKVFDSVTLRKRGGGGGGGAETPPVVPPPSASSPQPAAAAVATASTKENAGGKAVVPRLLSQRRILLRGGEVAAAVAAATVLSG